MALTFMLVLAEIDLPTKERGSKLDAIGPSGTDNIKIVLLLLAKVIAFHV